MTENPAADGPATPDDGSAPGTGGAWLLATFRVSSSHPFVLDGRDVPGAVRELEDVVGLVEREGVAVRGWYDVTGFRSDADLLLWLTARAAEDLQWGYRELRRTSMLRPLVRSGSSIAEAEARPSGDAAGWLAVLGLSDARHGEDDGGRGGLAAVDVSAGERIEAVEADTADELFGRLRGAVSAPIHLGRLIAPVEIVEVLQ